MDFHGFDISVQNHYIPGALDIGAVVGMPSKNKKEPKICTEEGCSCGHEARIDAPKIKAVPKGGEVLHLTDDDFEVVKNQSDLLVVDFWASWCGPCMAFGPVLEKFAKAHAGEVVVGKMNVDENNVVPALFEVESIPSIVFFKKGKALGMVVGAVPLQKLESIYKDLMAKS